MAKKVSTNTIKNLIVKNEEIVNFKNNENEIEIKIKKYLPISEKQELIELVCSNAFVDGKYDNLLKEIAYDILITKYYTNINLPQDNSIAYDALNSCGLIYLIINSIPVSEHNFLRSNIESKIEEEKNRINKENELAGVIKKALSTLIEKIPDMESIQKILGDFKDLDLGKLEQVNKLKEVIEGSK